MPPESDGERQQSVSSPFTDTGERFLFLQSNKDRCIEITKKKSVK